MGYIFFLYRNMRDTGRIEQCFVSWLVKEGASHFSARWLQGINLEQIFLILRTSLRSLIQMEEVRTHWFRKSMYKNILWLLKSFLHVSFAM